MNSVMVCPKSVLGPSTVCRDGIPESSNGYPLLEKGAKLVCRAWQDACPSEKCNDECVHYPEVEGNPKENCIGFAGYCKFIDGAIFGDSGMVL